MKLVSFDGGRLGVVVDHEVVELFEERPFSRSSWPPMGMVCLIAEFSSRVSQIDAAMARGRRVPLASVRLDPPIAWPNKVVAFPANYHAHVEEMKTGTGLISAFKADGQGFFLKANSSLSGPADPIVLPKIANREVHHECELAIIIGQGGRSISRAHAMDHVFGYSCLLDMVIRGKEERVMRKSFDSFCPIGPWIMTRDAAPHHESIQMELSVNGKTRQQANTRDLIVDIPDMIRLTSSVMTLYPGDIIATGTPAGVGPVAPGDHIRIEIFGVGAMELDVIQGEHGSHEIWRKASS